MRLGKLLPVLLMLLLVLLAPIAAEAQLYAAWALERLGMFTMYGAGARPSSMGYAYTSVSDDAFAPLYNPAGSCQMEMGELSASLKYMQNTLEYAYEIDAGEGKSSSTSLGHVAVVYPVHTYDRTWTFGFGIYNVGSSNVDERKSGRLDFIPADVYNSLTQTGNVYQYHFALAGEITKKVMIGASFVIWDQNLDFDETIQYSDADSMATFVDRVSSNLDAYSANFGLMLLPSEHWRLGLMITTPVTLKYYGNSTSYYEGQYTAGGGWTTDPYYATIYDEWTMPTTFRFGGSYKLPSILFSADFAYIPYSQTKYLGSPIVDQSSPAQPRALDDIWNIFLGADFSATREFGVRAGYFYAPQPFGMMDMFTYIENDELVMWMEPAESQFDNMGFTIGMGGSFDESLSVDFSTVYRRFRRKAENLTESYDSWEFLLSGGYHW
jgi:hypothetical protein